MSAPNSQVVVDLRAAAAKTRNAYVFAVVDRVLDVGSPDDIVVLCDHDLSSLCYQLDLRPESRGRFDFETSQRRDGAWVALIKRRVEKR
ncbi:MAG: hypothetical protein WBJ62_11150 [Coriobacteriia bacterium]|jgi:uncharacterized protein (DUF2249 family)